MLDTHTIDTHTTLYFSKEEIAEKTGISQHTLQNWINANKPIEGEFETLRGGKRTYFSVYIEKIFTSANRAELLPKLRPDDSLTSGQTEVNHQSTMSQPVPSQWSSNSQVAKMENATSNPNNLHNTEIVELVNQKWEASVAGKDEVILLLKEQLESTKQQIDLKDSQITDLSRNLNQQQILQMETVKEVGRLREENQQLLLKREELVVDQIDPTPEFEQVQPPIQPDLPPKKKGMLQWFGF